MYVIPSTEIRHFSTIPSIFTNFYFRPNEPYHVSINFFTKTAKIFVAESGLFQSVLKGFAR